MQNFFKLQSVTRHISRIILPCGVCVYLVQGTHEAVLLDTGFGIGDLRGFVEQNVTTPYRVWLSTAIWIMREARRNLKRSG